MAVQQTTLTRLYIVAAALFLLGFGIAYRMVVLQFVQGDKYRQLAEERTVKNKVIPPLRGNIYADEGSLLATSISKYTIRFDGVTVRQHLFDKYASALADSLSNRFGKSSNHYLKLLQEARTKKIRYQPIAKNCSYSDYVALKNFPLFEFGGVRGGLVVEETVVREHPLGKVAERTIGYEKKDATNHTLRVGLEGAFGQLLGGEAGKRLMQRVANGEWKPLTDANQQEPKDGYDVITTLNVDMQDVAHNALLQQLETFEADHGSVIVMETQTGAIKAMANLGRTAKGTYFEKLNYAVGESHEPGSTFKLMAMMAALEDGVIDTTTVVDTEKGELTFYGKYKVRDSKKGGYGKISAKEVFQVSSNTGIVKIIHENYKDQPEKFVDRLYTLGMNLPLDISISGEGVPKIPHPNDKSWNGITLPWMAYGYGVSLTPLQTLTFYNAVANQGEMIKPQFIKAIKRLGNHPTKEIEKEVLNPSICSKTTLAKLRAMMEAVVSEKKGTAHNIYDPNFSMAGKTGTCQRDYNSDNVQYISSFVGYFPADAPQYSCIVVIHKPNKKKGYYGSTVAAPVFKAIARKIYRSSPIDAPITQSQYQSTLSKNINVEVLEADQDKVPNVKGMQARDALYLLENQGFIVKVIGRGVVKNQSIAPGQSLSKSNKTITIELS